jgi:N-acetyl-beta-hexosaminidase
VKSGRTSVRRQAWSRHRPQVAAEGYHLTIGDERIGLVARDGAGLAHGFSTLVQLVRQCGRRLPRVHIEDHPDFAQRGVMLDISRDKVPTMDTLYRLIDLLASWKINQLQLYMEHVSRTSATGGVEGRFATDGRRSWRWTRTAGAARGAGAEPE